MSISMDEYYKQELYPRMLRHLDKYGDAGGWRQMSRCFAISHYVKARWNELTKNRAEGDCPDRTELLNEVASIDPAIIRNNHSIFIKSCHFYFPESGDINEVTLQKDHFWYTFRRMRGVRACDMVATLCEMATRIESIDEDVNELSVQAIKESAHLGPHLKLDIPDWVLSKVSEEIIHQVVIHGKPYDVKDEYYQRRINEWVGRVFEIMLQDIRKDYSQEDCVFFQKCPMSLINFIIPDWSSSGKTMTALMPVVLDTVLNYSEKGLKVFGLIIPALVERFSLTLAVFPAKAASLLSIY